MTQNRICSFPPIIGGRPETLILGTMPGVRSLEAGEYYGHPQNQFWRFMGDIYGAGRDLPYQRRTEILIANGVAVWDVFHSCLRPGSMDADIMEETVNDFAVFFKDYPTIRKVVFDSGKAEHGYMRQVLAALPKTMDSIEYHRVPSPSPAYARMRYEEKLKVWREVLMDVNNGSP